MVEIGKQAPDFCLMSSHGKEVKLSDLKGKNIVLYFYPKDDTPGCTLEAKDFRDALPEFEKREASVIGVSPDSVESHCQFRDKYGLNFMLLSDMNHHVIQAYGVWGEKNMYGKKSVGLIRSTVLINSQLIVTYLFSNVRVAGHVKKVLAVLDKM